MQDFRNFVLQNCILIFDAEQVYLKLQVTNVKNKEVTANPKPQALKKNWSFENPKPYTLDPRPKTPFTLNPQPSTPTLTLKFQP